jgi:hypothetical protein
LAGEITEGMMLRSKMIIFTLIMKIVPVVRKANLKEIDEDLEDMQYWLSRPPAERAAAVTSLISQSLKPDQRMDKTFVLKRFLHP